MNADIATFLYVNHRNETALRTVRPIRIWFGSTAWHHESQWFMEAFDLDKMETRDFALSGFAGVWGRVQNQAERRVSDAESGRGSESS